MFEIVSGTAQFSHPDQRSIDCMVLMEGEPTPFTAVEGDASTEWAWVQLVSGGIAPYVEPVPPPDPVPSSITRRQIMTGLAIAGWITEQEALDAIATGARPAAVEAVISALPEDQQFHARMKWAGFTEAYRDDPLVLALASAEGKSSEEIDDFFRMCAAIE